MPELPEVEAVVRKLRADAGGARIVRARVLRPGIAGPQDPAEVEAAAGQRINAIERRGKNIVIRLSGGQFLRVHLRMTGNLFVIPDVRLRVAATRAWFEIDGGRGIVFEDSRALGKIHIHRDGEHASLFADIGIEPFDAAFTPDWFAKRARGSRLQAKQFLMDQRHIAGLGNIYAAEALFRARVNPLKPIAGVSKAKLVTLHGAIVAILRDAVESAVKAYSRPGGFTEAEEFPLAVYGREGEKCQVCGKAIRRIAQGGRSTYYCGACQR